MDTSSSAFTCEFCGTILSNSWNLKRHIEKSKSCLMVRGEKSTTIQSCGDCEYKTSTMFNLSRHLETCKLRKARIRKEESEEKRRLEDYIIKLETENDMRRKQLLEQQSRPNIVNNNNQLNITLNLQLEHSQRILTPYSTLEKEQARILEGWVSKSVCKEGIKGLAHVIIDKLLAHNGKKWMISYEPNKTAFHTKNDEKEIRIDDRAEKFFEPLVPIIKNIGEKHFGSLMNEATSKSESYKIDESRKEFSAILDKGTPERKKIVRMIANGMCISRASLLSTKLNDQIPGKARLDFCDTLPDDVIPDPNNWFHSSDPEYLAMRNGTNFTESSLSPNFKTRARMLGFKE